MSVMRKGQQLHPDDWDGSGMADQDDSGGIVVVRFGDATTVATPADVCERLGIPLGVLDETMADLVAAGFLTPQADGSYTATIPEAHQ